MSEYGYDMGPLNDMQHDWSLQGYIPRITASRHLIGRASRVISLAMSINLWRRIIKAFFSPHQSTIEGIQTMLLVLYSQTNTFSVRQEYKVCAARSNKAWSRDRDGPVWLSQTWHKTTGWFNGDFLGTCYVPQPYFN